MLRAVVGLTVALWSSIAFADEASARKKYEAGERAYNLGEFEKAVNLFKDAYAEWAEPAFLFNIAQTYRQQGDCKQALFFYKRFLALKQNDTRKPIKPELQAEVEKRIVELEDCMRRELAGKPPDALDSGTSSTHPTGTQTGPTSQNASTTTAQVEQTDELDDEEEPFEPTPGLQPTMVSARFDAGAAIFGAGELDKATVFTAALIGGYPLALDDKLRLELGAAFSFAPVPYTTMMNEKGSGNLIGLMANVAPSYALIPKLSARADVGVGLLIFSGLEKGNPFTMSGAAATGPLSTFHARVAASLDYGVTNNVVITATPIAFSYSPAPKGFAPTISSLTTLSFLVGLGYQR
jgi:hypothetical protein